MPEYSVEFPADTELLCCARAVLREVRTGATLEARGNLTPVPNEKFLTGARQHHTTLDGTVDLGR